MKWLLNLWHDIYYFFDNKRLERVALTCRQAVEEMEEDTDATRVRLALHLSLCDSCRKYHRFSKSFRQHLKMNPMLAVSRKNPEVNLEELSLKLMNQYSRKEK